MFPGLESRAVQLNNFKLSPPALLPRILYPTQLQLYSMTQGQSSFTMTIQLERSSQGWKCEQCGLPGVRLSSSSGSAYYKCVPCNRSLGSCPCTTPGARTTSTCPCGDSDAESSGSEDHVPRGLSMLKKQTSNPYNPGSEFEEDWESNCSPGFMVSRFKAQGRELLLWH
ncbi:hypothetical protein N7471_009889 [Penicillium samsonianum]|uniref:uncharacterized protein n=1 Tax=Penicillium samsonianum TaxID=1882272 RepID=UPI002548B98C|nr:uncharacterized protein N7471_009889 [Penicillium samsonianum]KAJ6128672.1 hypothetical protein N7471_009889 [Penicillium samsonianum]